MCTKHSLAIWLFCLTFFGVQHQDNQVKHTEASKQYITANKAFSTKIPTTTVRTTTSTASTGTTKQVIGDVLQIENEEYVELGEDTIHSESIPDLNDDEDDDNNDDNDDDHNDINALTVYHLRNQMNDVQKKNAIKRKYLLQELLRQHEQTFKGTQQIYNDTGGSGASDTADGAGNEGKSILLPINSKSLLKYSKHKKNVGDTLAFDFKQNVQRLFNNTKSNDNRSHKELHVNSTLPSLLPVTDIAKEQAFTSTLSYTTTTAASTGIYSHSASKPTASTTSAFNSTDWLHTFKHSTLGRRHIVPEKLQYTKEITIKQGRLIGIRRTFHSSTGLRDVDQYLGLPYAESPVGNRRFMPPGAPLPWQGLKMAHHLPSVCPQKLPDITAAMSSGNAAGKLSKGRYKYWTRLLPYLKIENEDCLHLNVYVPSENDVTAALFQRKFLYPVIVYIHGESFDWNSGNAYDGSVLASYGEVIVVTVNYRLGILGFMRPSINENTVANFGLLDQIAALHWIKENIGYFGGDKDSVTLMGHTTGAACVNYLMISPVASGLFHRAILMSGSAMSDWAASNYSLQLTMQIAHGLNCPLNDDNEEMLTCLRQKRHQDILKIPTSLSQFSTSLGPIVDGHVIPDQPYKVMGQYTEHFSRYDLLFGITESESYHSLGVATLDEGLRENERDNLLRFYTQSRFDVRPDLALAATLKKYSDMYTNPIKASKLEHRDVVLDILSDARVVGPLMQTGLFHAELPHSIAGEELPFIFGAPLAAVGPFHGIHYTSQEKLLAEAVMSYWSNFVKTGNPKAPWKGTFINLHALEWDHYDLDWPKFNKRAQAYMNIGIPPSVGYKYRQIYMNFWNKELPDELNQIAVIQQQPYFHSDARFQNAQTQRVDNNNNNNNINNNRNNNNNDDVADKDDDGKIYPKRYSSEVITGHMNKFGTRADGADDPVRTLKLLLQEPYVNGKTEGIVGGDANGVGRSSETAENMYNASPIQQGVHHQAQSKEDKQLYYGNTVHTIITDTNLADKPDDGKIIYGIQHSSGTTVATTLTATTSNIQQSINKLKNYNNGNESERESKHKSTKEQDDEQEQQEQILKSETTLHLLIGLIVIFIVLNVIIYSTYLLQKKKKTKTMQRKLGTILTYDGATDDELKRSKQTTQHDGDESYVMDMVRKSNAYEAVKTERSPLNGYKITRQLSCSTVDTHTKVCEWMESKLQAGSSLPRRPSSPKSSKKSSSFSSLAGSGSSFGKHPQKVSVAVDATSQGRGSSVLQQEPIEITKYKADGRNIIICQEVEVEDHELLTPQESLDNSRYSLVRQHSANTDCCNTEFLQPIHKHSRSDPVETYYSFDEVELSEQEDQEKITSFITPDPSYDNDSPLKDINVTSCDSDRAEENKPLTVEQQLSVIKRRKYPKVLPPLLIGENHRDSPPMTQDLSTTYKRNSLPPNNFLYQLHHHLSRQPPLPPPRTVATLGRKTSLTRRNSNIVSNSPLMLAQDCTEEEEEPEITKNTLIVGSLAPKSNKGNEGYYTTLRRRAQETAANETLNKTLTMQKQQQQSLPTTAFQSFESFPAETPEREMPAHLTERVYSIEAVRSSIATTPLYHHQQHSPSCYASAPTTPNALPVNSPLMSYPTLPNGSLHALYSQCKKSHIPRIVAASSSCHNTNMNTKTTTTTNATHSILTPLQTITAHPLNCPESISQQVSATLLTSLAKPSSPLLSSKTSTLSSTDVAMPEEVISSSDCTALTVPSSPTRIPQLQRNANVTNCNSQQQQLQQPLLLQYVNKDKSNPANLTKVLTPIPQSNAIPTVSDEQCSNSHLGNNTTTNNSNKNASPATSLCSKISSHANTTVAPASTVLPSTLTSSSSSASSLSSSSTSSTSTGTVRTELQQQN
uniref:Carboxylesterase type B domain-containing protein n=1 Tax=Glossina brevipalpis TaxID=37001 RepID=A0A1A9W1F4_9MUSC